MITPDQHWSNLLTLLECVLTLLQSVQVPINPYGKAKKMAEDIILDYVKSNTQLAVMILRCVNLFLT
jgi:UDP-glucose 4-epimerase